MTQTVPDLVIVGQQIRAAREAQGLSRAKLAQRAGWHESTIKNIEAGRHGSEASVATLAQVLGLDDLATPPELVALRQDVAALRQEVDRLQRERTAALALLGRGPKEDLIAELQKLLRGGDR